MTTTEKYNIAIIGAGIMGLNCAYALSKDGHTITAYDPQDIPSNNASFVAGGMLAPFSEIEHLPESFIEAGLRSIDIWQDILPDLKNKVDFKQNGSLMIAHKEDTYLLDRFESHLPKSSQQWQKMNKEDIAQLEPQLADKFKTGIYIAGEAHIHPREAMQAISSTLKTMKNFSHQKCEAYPDTINSKYDYVIDCRGYAAEVDDPELRGIKGELLIVRNEKFELDRPVRLMHPRYPLYIVPRPDHVFMIGATIIEGAEEDDEQVSVRSALELLSALYSLHPSFDEAKILEIIAGIRPAYNDNLPRIKINKNVISCNGLFRHGFLLSPIIAKCITASIKGKTTAFTGLFTKGTSDETHHQRQEKNIQTAA